MRLRACEIIGIRTHAENEVAILRIANVGMNMAGFGGKIIEGACVFFEEFLEIFVIGDIEKMPVIEPRTLELPVVDRKAERPDEMEPRAGCGAGARDVAGILGDFGFYQNDVERRHGSVFSKKHFRLLLKKS